MDEIYEILKYTLPSLIVFVAVFLVLKKFLDNEHRNAVYDFKKGNLKLITPIRLQAYERSALFLERIGMENLITRVNQPRMTAEQLHVTLITSIRSEYEHNLSQQIYMSSDAWNAVKEAREETLKIIHTAMANTKSKGSAIELTTSIFTLLEGIDVPPNQRAIEILKKEVRRLF
ncbi:MAG TPA: hypothetical protein DCX54_03860 [Flavobacteriales bacterium]|nr:hypothetical protein [Flavobacteriales bacterium]